MHNWATNLTRGLAHWAIYKQCVNFTKIPEGAFQLTAEELLRSHWHSRIEANYNIDFIKHGGSGRPKQLDIALLDGVDNRIPKAVFEIKSAVKSHKSSASFFKNGIIEDVIRLALYSAETKGQCKCFFLLAGDYEPMIKALISKKFGQILEFTPRDKNIASKKISELEIHNVKPFSNYREPLQKQEVKSIYSRLRRRGLASNIKEPNMAVYLWQIAHSKDALVDGIDKLFVP